MMPKPSDDEIRMEPARVERIISTAAPTDDEDGSSTHDGPPLACREGAQGRRGCRCPCRLELPDGLQSVDMTASRAGLRGHHGRRRRRGGAEV
eukprot:scaffold2753_cov115-Isochrysis_galbana.AAC.10